MSKKDEALSEPVEWLTGCPECGMDGGCDCDSGTWNPPAQQEPVGQLQEEVYGRGQVMWFNKPADQSMLYTSPPASKPWVGLTLEERQACTQSPFTSENYLAIEAKLREKNT